MNTKYNTFWRRFAAGLLDGFIFLPLTFLNDFVKYHSNLPLIATLIWQAFYFFARPAYAIWMHSKYGQTIGKKAVGVILLNLKETRIISNKEAFIRESPDIIIIVVYLIFEAYYSITGDIVAPVITILLTVFVFAHSIWSLLEIITTLTNDKRRALHDFIAGSVVIKKECMFLENFPEHPEQFANEKTHNIIHA